METELAELAARVAALQSSAQGTNTAFAEVVYYLTIPLMILIHAGFLAYEMGASRQKNVLASGIKNILAFAFIVPTFYYLGWFIYWAFPSGFSLAAGPNGVSGLDYAATIAAPWSESMGPNHSDNSSGVFWGAFTLFAATTASIFSGAVIERIQVVGFVLLSVLLGAVVWTLAAAWGWHADGWLVTQFGVHDFGAAGAVHAVAGFFALGVLLNLGPRIGKYGADGSVNVIAAHNLPITLLGLMLIIAGFWGFLLACVIAPGEAWSWDPLKFSSIYGTPITLSSLAFNVLMGFAGGVIGAWTTTRDPFWMMSGGLGGIIATAAGIDLYWPPLAFVIAFGGGALLKVCHGFVERRGVDDAVAAVSLHGALGAYSLLALGVFASGYPALLGDAPPVISLGGQLLAVIVFGALGFLSGFGASWVLKRANLLRVSRAAEIQGLDPTKVPVSAYPEGINISPSPVAH